ncbi:MAG TPA: ABC transporter substrate-binding protein [Actinomycetales bacterium]
MLLLACACSSAETAANASEEDSTTCTIGGMNATTGALGFVGKAEIEGMNIALEDINAAGGIQGKPLAFDIADDQGSVNTGTTNFKRLAAKYPIIIGPGITAVAQATAGLATSNKVVMMTFVGQPEVTEGTDYVFEIVGSQNSNTQSMVNYLASEYGVKEASIIAINDAYGTNGLKLLNEAAASSGMKITSTNTFNADAFDFTPQASTIAQEDPPGLLFNGSGGAATPQALKAIRAAGYKGPIVADVTLATQEVPKIAGNEAADTVVAMSQINYPEPNEVTKKFFASYAARNDGGVPSSLNAEGYDAVTVVAMALQETGCNTTGDKLVKALENVTYDGILGVHDYEPGKHAGADASSFKPITFKNGQFAAPADN